MKRFLLHGLLVGSCLVSFAGAGAGVDDFYIARLRAGRDAYRSKQFAEAADELRIASFGFLDNGPLLMESLVRLGLAQNAAGRKVELAATLERFVDLERRHAFYAKAAVEPETRAEFESLLLGRIAPEQLRVVPTLARLVEAPPAPQLDDLPPAQRKAAVAELEAKDRANPAWPLQLARLAAAEGEQKDVVRWTSRVLELDADEPEAFELRARAHVERKEFADALADLNALPAERRKAPAVQADLFVAHVGVRDFPAARAALANVPQELRARPDVARALKRLPAEAATPEAGVPPVPAPPAATPTVVAASKPAEQEPTPAAIAAVLKTAEEGKAAEAAEQLRGWAARFPKSRDVRKALLEAACLAKEWKVAADQVARVEPFQDGEEASMFYAAVSLYQTGSADAAKGLMARARPKIGTNPFVEHYAKKILGTS